MREREGQLVFKVAVFNNYQPVNVEEVLGEDKISELENHLQDTTDQWLLDHLEDEDPSMEAQAEVQ